MLGELLRCIDSQIEANNARALIEVIVDLDNKEKSTGRKRQDLLERSRGTGVLYIDDDDWIMEYYIEEMLKAAQADVDCVAISGVMTTNGGAPINWHISKDYDNVTVVKNGERCYLRHTNHITLVRRSIALEAGFNDVSNAEDGYYSGRLKGKLQTEYKIEKPMYHYRYSSQNKSYK
jgi:hypothetical protein